MLSGVKSGETDIVVTSENNSKVFARCHVKVGLAVTGVELSAKNETLKIGETLKLTAKVAPSNATDKTVIWSIDEEGKEIAVVDSDGVVTPKKNGFVTVRATSKQNPGATGTCRIEVLRIWRK